MVLKNNFLKYIFPLLLTTPILSQDKIAEEKYFVKDPLVEMMAKQSTSNIRFISNDGKITYYQKRSGQLLLSSNYKLTEILSASNGTQYNVHGTSARKKLIIAQNENFHNYYSIKNPNKIFVLNFGGSNPREVGLGSHPRLHLNDDWISYYQAFSKTIQLEHTTNSALKYKIQISALKNPYFFPQVEMISDDAVLYTDMNEKGEIGLFLFRKSTAESKLVYKSENLFNKLELCSNGDSVFMGEFGTNSSTSGSKISQSAIDSVSNTVNFKLIYESSLNDPGNIVCSDKTAIYFSKNIGSSNLNSIYEIVSLNLDSKTIKAHTYFKSTTQIIDMDGVYLVSEKGKTYILKGNHNFKFVDVLAAPNKGEGN